MRTSILALVVGLAVTTSTQATKIALEQGHYPGGPYAVLAGWYTGDGNASISYDPRAGELRVLVWDTELTSINIQSASSIFTGDPADHLGQAFDNHTPDNIFKATFGGSFGSLSF